MAQDVESDGDEDMLEALQTRHTQRLEEFKSQESPEHVVEVPAQPLSPSTGKNVATAQDSVETWGGSTVGSGPTSPSGGTLNQSVRERIRNRPKTGRFVFKIGRFWLKTRSEMSFHLSCISY